MKQRVKIKPLSVNKAWQGRRFKTKMYRDFETLLLLHLTPFSVDYKHIELHFTFGFSTDAADLSNPVKLIEDILQKKYRFNDNKVTKIVAEKELTDKGKEFIEFEIKEGKAPKRRKG